MDSYIFKTTFQEMICLDCYNKNLDNYKKEASRSLAYLWKDDSSKDIISFIGINEFVYSYKIEDIYSAKVNEKCAVDNTNQYAGLYLMIKPRDCASNKFEEIVFQNIDDAVKAYKIIKRVINGHSC